MKVLSPRATTISSIKEWSNDRTAVLIKGIAFQGTGHGVLRHDLSRFSTEHAKEQKPQEFAACN